MGIFEMTVQNCTPRVHNLIIQRCIWERSDRVRSVLGLYLLVTQTHQPGVPSSLLPVHRIPNSSE